MTCSRSGVRPCVASHMFCIFLHYPPQPQSRCPCNCQVMFRVRLLLYYHYSCSGLMRLPIVATGLAAFQKRGPPSIYYTQAAFTKVCISRQSSSVFILCFFLLNQSWRGHWRLFFFLPNLISVTPPCPYQIFPSRLAPRGRPTFTTQCRLNHPDLLIFMVILCPELPNSHLSDERIK